MIPAALQLDYVESHELARQPAPWWDGVLGVVGFDAPPSAIVPVPLAASWTPGLGCSGSLCEVWRVSKSATPGRTRRQGQVHYRDGGDFLFGSLTCDGPGGDGDAAALRAATQAAYRQIFHLIETPPRRHLVRVWNYLPDINRHADGEERYRHFNAARQAAFREAGRSLVDTVPSACALGSPSGSPLVVYFLASLQAPCMVENPRQISAYHYPRAYGAHSPTFSRACLLDGVAGTTLFVSGTASIVGHQTIHPGDVRAQTLETLANIDALLDEANRIAGPGRYAFARLKLKVYVRRSADLDAIERVLAPRLAGQPVIYLKADVCREDLLVEIEATGGA